MSGPLSGLRVVELAGIGPGPFAAMMLSDMGAEVLRVDRAQAVEEDVPRWDVHARGRRSVAVDLKHPGGPEVVLRLAARADAFLEGFRPGVAERLGLGPDECLARQPRLVYGRMTGWGRSGPYAQAAGRDINYVALSGTLSMIGRAGRRRSLPRCWWATSVVAGCCSPSASCAGSSRRPDRGGGRWSMRRSSTGPRCSQA
jgi:alpha-methylacyl-CoA racemase